MAEFKFKFCTSMRILTAHYESNVSVYDDKVVIERTGKTGGLPSDSTIYFRDATAVSWGEAVGRSWITFSVPGVVTRAQQVVTAVRPGQIAFAPGPYIPYDDPFSVVFGLREEYESENNYQKIKKLFDAYKAKAAEQSAVSNTMIYQDSVMDKLRKLKELKDMGILNGEEYEEKRVKLLSEI